ncbi:MAG TPA: hypothetical protein VFN78_10200 [Ktedonobacterales bacterium]|nr:hypothetical protein [Ktedonobacterales bacterium]
MLLSMAPLAVAAALIWISPGLVWGWLAYPAPDRIPRLAVGAALGLALQIALAAPLAATVGITRASVVLTTAASLALALALGLTLRVRTVRLPSRVAARWRETLWFVALALASVAICAVPLAWQTVPDGWDPSFHSLLASVTIATGKLPTWQPFEPISSNYPYGAHIALAEISLLTGLQPHQVFGSLLNVVIPALASLQIYTLARRMWRSGPAALGAVAAYGLLGYANSVDYAAWGGLPNALGLILLLASLEAFFAPGFMWRRVAVAGLLLSAVPLTHHHVALTTGLLYGIYGLALLALIFLRRPQRWRAPDVIRRSAQRALVRLGAMAGLALALASYSFLPYVVRGVHSLRDTSVFADFGEYQGWPFDKNGVALWLMASAGVALLAWRHWRATGGSVGHDDQRLYRAVRRLYPRRGAEHARLFAVLALVALFSAFVFGQFIFHDIMWALYHRDETAFSPPRFLSNMTYFLALYAGPALAWLWRLGPCVGVERARINVWAARALRVALVALALSVALESLFASGQVGARAGQLAPGDMAAFQWTRTHTASDALVVALDGSDARWAPYFTQREAVYTPLPASEDAAGYPAEKRMLLQWTLLALGAHPRLGMVAMASEGPALSVLAQRPVVFITDAASPALGTLDFTSGPTHVYVSPSLLSLTHAQPAMRVSLWWRSPTAGAPPANWTDAIVSQQGWTQGVSDVSAAAGATWLRMRPLTPLPHGAAILCYGQDGALLYLDGRLYPRACTGALVPLNQLSAPGPHIIALRALHGLHAHPWLIVALMADATSSVAAGPVAGQARSAGGPRALTAQGTCFALRLPARDGARRACARAG